MRKRINMLLFYIFIEVWKIEKPKPILLKTEKLSPNFSWKMFNIYRWILNKSDWLTVMELQAKEYVKNLIINK